MSTATTEVFLTERAQQLAAEFENQTDPEAHALGSMTALVTLLTARIAALQIADRATDTPAGRLLRERHMDAAVRQMDEALDFVNGWHAAQDRLAARRAAENSLATVQWPAVS